MKQKICKDIEVFSLTHSGEVTPAVEAVLNGKIAVFRLGSVFSFVLNPNIAGLPDKFNLLKGRHKTQSLSTVCSYEQAKLFVDKARVNEDFFSIPADLCSKVILRIPVEKTVTHKLPHNTKQETMQFLNFEAHHKVRCAFRDELAAKGCDHISITSGNIHGAPTIEELEPAKMLATVFNIKADFFGMDLETIVTDFPDEVGGQKGSYIVLSFCNKEAIEVKRLANKIDREVTEKCLKELFRDIKTQTPLVYALDET